MSAGLPGFGLGGLFFILSALLAPAVELARTVRGRSSPGAWRGVWRQFAIALTMIVAVDLALRLLVIAGAALGTGGGSATEGITRLPLAPIVLTAGLLIVVLLGAKALQLLLRVRAWASGVRRRDRRSPPVTEPV